ncbi:O-antigen polymerase [Olleya sp. R77988]|uniref:O-antigen polymerase n=1 Tax=Olleya sp. R77988 TaxID=3093875 RepID=UPI0037C64193
MLKIKFTYPITVLIYITFFLIGTTLGYNPYGLTILISFFEILKQIRNNSFFTALLFWNLGFVFLSCSVNLFDKVDIVEKFGIGVYEKTANIFFLSSITIIFFYHYFLKKQKQKYPVEVEVDNSPFTSIKTFTLLLIIAVYLIFIIYNGQRAFQIMTMGRGTFVVNSSFGGQGEQGTGRSIIITLLYYLTEISGYLLPSLMFLILLQKLRILYALAVTFILSVPIWMTQFFLGTRHHILLSGLSFIACFVLLYHKRIRIKVRTFVIILSAGLFFSFAMLHIRKVGYANIFDFSNFKFEPEKIGGDPSGRYMNYVVEYFDTKDYRKGVSTTGLVFVWMPRSIWNNKPQGFTHWFLREHVIPGYKGYNSISTSYLGVPYSDFGKTGVVFASILIAFFLAKIDCYTLRLKSAFTFKKLIIVAFSLALSFYMPRALTAVYLKMILVFAFISVLSFSNRLVIRIPDE